MMFQFTHPGRGATEPNNAMVMRAESFNSRTPGGVRRLFGERRKGARRVSIHAPREGCDYRLRGIARRALRFNSRTPGGVRLKLTGQGHQLTDGFNSRTPGGVRRIAVSEQTTPHERFNSRTPGGVRLVVAMRPISLLQFQFTHPGRGATCSVSLRAYTLLLFQFTHPGRGATLLSHICAIQMYSFNSRTPGGVRLGTLRLDDVEIQVSIHAPREGCDYTCVTIPWVRCMKFQFTHPGRGATG